MKKLIAATVAAFALTAGAAYAESGVQVGRLSCEVAGGPGLVFVSSKDVTCDFIRKGKKTEHYSGSINKVGIDIGFTKVTKIEWLVFAATDAKMGKHALAGQYVGGSAEWTVGIGFGANWLIGGFEKSYALQPWSVQAQTGLNFSYTLTNLTLN
ncbi:MAG: DUF992 domain-containing protein [Devosia sp.]